MPLLLDTYNILHVVGILPPEMAGLDTEGLARLLDASSRWREQECWLICDGTPKGPAPEPMGKIRIEFAGPGVTADEVIARRVEASSSPRRITVVSSDRQVQRDARRRRCRVMDAPTFLAQLVQDARHGDGQARDAPLPTDSTDEWIDAFDLDDRLDIQGAADLPDKPQQEPGPRQEPPEPPQETEGGTEPPSQETNALDELNMDDLIDEEGRWKGPDS